jgi:hypothetical protein
MEGWTQSQSFSAFWSLPLNAQVFTGRRLKYCLCALQFRQRQNRHSDKLLSIVLWFFRFSSRCDHLFWMEKIQEWNRSHLTFLIEVYILFLRSFVKESFISGEFAIGNHFYSCYALNRKKFKNLNIDFECFKLRTNMRKSIRYERCSPNKFK